jgi:protein-tyrosine phosphatase
MTDIHCHILYGIDDGPAAVGEAIDLLRMAEDNGIDHIIATPHLLRMDASEEFISARDEKLRVLSGLAAENRINVRLYPGAEVYMSDEAVSSPDLLRRLTLNNSRYLLIEIHDRALDEKRFLAYIRELTGQGLTPVVAHPERYRLFQTSRRPLHEALQAGALFQVNADALCGFAARGEAKLSRELVKNGLAAFIATDAHSIRYRPNNLLDMINRFPKYIDDAQLRRLVVDNPQAVLHDECITATRHW